MKTFALSAMMASWLAVGAAPAFGADAPDKWFVVEGAVNTQAGFMIRVDVDKPDRVYVARETRKRATR